MVNERDVFAQEAMKNKWHQSVADFRLWVQPPKINGCRQWKADNVAPSAVTLKTIAAGDEMKRQRRTPVYPTNININWGTSPRWARNVMRLVQSCT